jgi:hypothetical protein
MNDTTRAIRPRGLIHLGLAGALAVSFGARDAYALGELAPAAIVSRMVDGKLAQKDLAVEPIDIDVRSATVKQLHLRSEIEDASGQLVDAGEVGRTVLERNPGISLRPGVIVARRGEMISVPRPHKRELAPGVYSESVRLAVVDSAYSAPVIVSRLRFFRVGSDGAVEVIDSAAYSRLVDGRGRADKDRDGVIVEVNDGKGFSPASEKSKQRAVPILDATGRIGNLDAEVKLPPTRTQPAEDESKED